MKAGFFYESEEKTYCSVWAPLAKKVELVIVSQERQVIRLRKNRSGYWQSFMPLAEPGLKYFFQVDDGDPLPDPASLYQPDGIHGPSELVNRNEYDWNDKDWKGLALAEMIIYEIHTGTFTPEGNFDGIIGKLDYLVDLGINTIELMPVAQFPGTRGWGYDGVFPFAVQNSYGGIHKLKQLVDAAHRKGIAVILDVVYNHLGPEGNYLGGFGPYTNDKYKTPWGAAINFDDEYCDGAREFFIQNALMWLNDFHIDGLRLDAVHAIWDSGAKHFLHELQERVKELERTSDRKKVLIAELDLNSPRFINDPQKGGYGLDGQWLDEFHHALHSLITGEKNGYYQDFGSLKDLEKSFRDSYVFTGQYSNLRKKKFGTPVSNPYHQFIVFAQNHDHTGNRLNGDRMTTILEEIHRKEESAHAHPSETQTEKTLFNVLKLVAATVLLSPHIPLLFMGEEYGEKNPFLFFMDYTDEVLVANTAEGRKKEFAGFGWVGAVPDAKSEDTFLKSKLSWEMESPNRKKLFEFHKFLIEFRKTHPAMKAMEREDIIVYPSVADKILAFQRIHLSSRLLIILNFSDKSETYPAAGFKGYKLFDSSDTEWNFDKKNEEENIISEPIGLAPYSALIIESNAHS